MRVIFVGLHNKPNLSPLCTSTKTGKLIQKIIWQLPLSTITSKSNIFDVDYYPKSTLHFELAQEWFWNQSPTENDIIILLGQATQNAYDIHCVHQDSKVIRVAHPASKRSHESMDEYVKNVSNLIITELNK